MLKIYSTTHPIQYVLFQAQAILSYNQLVAFEQQFLRLNKLAIREDSLNNHGHL